MSLLDQTHLEDAQSWDEELCDYDDRMSQYYSRLEALEKEKERQKKLRKENIENDKPKSFSAPRALGLGAAKKPIRMAVDEPEEIPDSPTSEIFTQADTRKTPANSSVSRLNDLTNAPRPANIQRESIIKKAKLDELRKKQKILEAELGLDDPTEKEAQSQQQLETMLGISSSSASLEQTKNAAESLEPDLISQQKSSLNNGTGPQYKPHYETIDLRYNRRVLRTKFTLDSSWTVERGQACFTTREGIPTTIEALIIRKRLKNAKRNDIAINLPVRCISSFYGGLKELIESREEFIRNNSKAECQEIENFGKLEDGSIDLSGMTHHGYPKCLIKLDGGYSIRVEEVSYNRGNFSGSYDTLCIKRSGVKESNQEFANAKAEAENVDETNPAKDFKSFSVGMPLKLVTALYKAVEYIYKHEYQLLERSEEKSKMLDEKRRLVNPRSSMSSVLYNQFLAEKDREFRELKEQYDVLKEENSLLAEKKVRFSSSNQNGKRIMPPLSPEEERALQEMRNKYAKRF